MEKKWWHKTVGYQIYPKSFQDTNGDGIGDLKGVIRHLDKIEKLGANVIWLCPVFASPMVDNGYDISDYMDIDPSFGTMEDMKELIEEAKKRGIRILMDLVMNHSSDRHAWFQAALKDPFGKYGKYYVFREGKDGKEPNNWLLFCEDVEVIQFIISRYFLPRAAGSQLGESQIAGRNL